MTQEELKAFIKSELRKVCRRRARNLKRPRIYEPLVQHDEGMIEAMHKTLELLDGFPVKFVD